jgi:hypothetical protein
LLEGWWGSVVSLIRLHTSCIASEPSSNWDRLGDRKSAVGEWW